MFHSTGSSEYCAYFRVSGYIINTVCVFTCGVLYDAFNANFPTGSSMLVSVVTIQQGGWMGYMWAVYHDIVIRT